MIEDLPNLNIFMMCASLNREALSALPAGYWVRNCRREELNIWKAMPFDTVREAEAYEWFMTDFFETTYGGKEELFFSQTLFVCDGRDQPIATGLLWKAYGEFNTIHWLKVAKAYEGKGIGRALLSILLKDLEPLEYPVYLHTQPESFRAIKLYSDFGFHLLSDPEIGRRKNDLEACLPMLEQYMPEQDFQQLKISKAPSAFLERLKDFDTIEF